MTKRIEFYGDSISGNCYKLQLAASKFIADTEFSIADIALYAYTHVAHDGGFELDNYPLIRQWIKRIEGRQRYVPMQES